MLGHKNYALWLRTHHHDKDDAEGKGDAEPVEPLGRRQRHGFVQVGRQLLRRFIFV